MQQALELLRNKVTKLEDEAKFNDFKVQNDPEKARLVDEVARLETEVAGKIPLHAENEALYSKVRFLTG